MNVNEGGRETDEMLVPRNDFSWIDNSVSGNTICVILESLRKAIGSIFVKPLGSMIFSPS